MLIYTGWATGVQQIELFVFVFFILQQGFGPNQFELPNELYTNDKLVAWSYIHDIQKIHSTML